MNIFASQKNDLIKKLQSEGYNDFILDSFKKVRREDFFPKKYWHLAYRDKAFPIGYGQTISQPSTIAFMLKLLNLKRGQKVLEIGSGSGYVLALLAESGLELDIYGAELIPALVQRSKKALKKYPAIKIFPAEKELGLKSESPFDRILLSASAPKLPKELFSQLAEFGVMVCPVKDSIIKVSKKNKRVDTESYPGFLFVPLCC